MSAKHTPGPWIIEEGDLGDAEIIITTRQRQHKLQMQICEMNVYLDGEFGVEQKANARLIAAAPVLLAFAQEWLERQGTDENYMTAKARAAIAKAIG